MLRSRLLAIYQALLNAYGPQHWWPGDTPWEVIVGAILTQSAAWTNVEKAIANLRAAGVLSVEGIHGTTEDALAALIRPSGYYNAKARKLKAFADHLFAVYSGDLAVMLARPVDELRAELLGIHGVGPETADSILLYAANRPVFVIDAYTRRSAARLGLCDLAIRYDALRALFMDTLPRQASLFNEYHALFVRLGKEACRKRPLCSVCPLAAQLCPSAGASAPAGSLAPTA
jgi:endonuclease-3 related protein